jgi:hypothetical protein
MLVTYILLLAFLLILFVLLTAIGFTFKLKVLSLEEKKELRGILTVKWLLFSHTFSVEEPGEKEYPLEEPDKSIKDGIIKEEQSKARREVTKEVKVTEETYEIKEKREIEVKSLEEKKIDVDEGKKEKTGHGKQKRGIIARIRGKKKPITEEAPKEGMSTREKLHWALEAFKSLRKPLFHLFSDLLNGIKIKRLESFITFGLSDPAETGMLCGVIHSVAGLAYSRCRHCSFSINPVFLNPMVDFRGSMEIRVRIYSVVLPMLKFMLNRKTLSFTYSIIKEKVWGKWKSHS